MWRRKAKREEIAELRVAGLDRPVSLRRSPRARRLSLRVSGTKSGAVLTLPASTSLSEAGDFLADHFDWLQKHLSRLPSPVPFAHGARIPVRGFDHDLRLVPDRRPRGRIWLEAADRGARITRGEDEVPQICVSGPPDGMASALTNWLKREARKDISARVAVHAANLGVTPSRITIRDQATRWGSCSAAGTLSFSWRLVMAPGFVLDYLAAHEVAHLRELNHGARFWQLVYKATPRCDEARVWLREHGPRLHRYGATA